jgi:hypothetical protein
MNKPPLEAFILASNLISEMEDNLEPQLDDCGPMPVLRGALGLMVAVHYIIHGEVNGAPLVNGDALAPAVEAARDALLAAGVAYVEAVGEDYRARVAAYGGKP